VSRGNDWALLQAQLANLQSQISGASSAVVGGIQIYSGSAAPTGYLLCDGTAVSRTTYSDLFAVTSTTYGVGDGSTTFNLPDLRTKVPVGKNPSGTFATLGATGGAETHTLLTAEIPSHTHTTNIAHGHSNNISIDDDSHNHSTNTAGDAGSTLSGTTNNYRFTDTGSPTLNTDSDTHSHSISGGVTALGTTNVTSSTGSGGGGAHNNLQPYLVLNFIIKT
jgi:microcystin-dependent protein